MTATAIHPDSEQVPRLTLRLHLAHRAVTEAANAQLDAEEALENTLAAGRQTTEAHLDALDNAEAALRLAKLEVRGLVRLRRRVTGTTNNPEPFDDQTVTMRGRIGVILRDGRRANAGDVVVVTGDEAVYYARLGHLLLAEPQPSWWPKGIVDYSGYDAHANRSR